MQGKAFNEAYKKLNPEQKKAVDTIDGPVFVMAGPGTGKTQILTLRIANIIKEAPGITPENILALTFTNTAAYNMRERLGAMIGAELAHRVYIGTFHSFAEDMIRRNADFFPKFFRARLASPVERIELLERVLENIETKHFSVFKRRDSTINALLSSFDTIKQEGATPEYFKEIAHHAFDTSLKDEELYYKVSRGNYKKGDIKPTELKKREHRRDKQLELADIYQVYQSALEEKHLYDFSDLIVSFIDVMEHEPDFKADMQEQFQYLLVDEHQDTNDAQNKIIHLLIDNPVNEGKPNIFVVGDDKQAIYRFAGASASSFAELKDRLADMQIIDLVHNYRSGQHVLDRAHSLIVQSGDHTATPQLNAFFSEYEGAIEYRQFSSYKMELLWLAQSVKERLDTGEPASDIAVLYRNNRDARDIEQLFGAYGIPYNDRSKKNILEDPDMLKLSLLFNGIRDLDNDIILGRVLYIDFLNISVSGAQALLRRLKNSRKDSRNSLFALISNASIAKDLGLSKQDSAAVSRLAEFLARAKRESMNLEFAHFFMWFVRESGFLGYVLGKPNSVYGLAKIERLFDEVKKESAARQELTFEDFLGYIASLKRYDLRLEVAPASGEGVEMMTFHGSKGLEFDTVYVVKALEKRKQGQEIPLPFDTFDHGDTEDERRLLYVALTRARKNLYISSHILSEDGKEKTPLSFIEQIDGMHTVSTLDFEKSAANRFADFFAPQQLSLQSITDQSFIEDRFLSSNLSVSALNNYMEEPILYFFRNLLCLPDVRTAPLEFGEFAHAILEEYFNRAKEDAAIPQVKVVEEIIESLVARTPFFRQYEKKARELVHAYINEYQDDFAIPLETELRIPALSFGLPDGRSITLTGVVDKITRDADGVVVWDYKTGKPFSSKSKADQEKIKRQAVFYKYLLMHTFDGRFSPDKVVFDFLEPNDDGEYERITFDITNDDIEVLKGEILALAQDVLEGKLLAHAPERNEKTAEYLELLEMIRGNAVQQTLFS